MKTGAIKNVGVTGGGGYAENPLFKLELRARYLAAKMGVDYLGAQDITDILAYDRTGIAVDREEMEIWFHVHTRPAAHEAFNMTGI